MAQAQTASVMGLGTEERSWLAADAAPPTRFSMAAPRHAARDVPNETSGLRRDPNTRLWGIPVPRLGDPDFAPGNPRYSGEIPDGPLILPAIVMAPDGRLDRALPCVLITNGYGIGDGNSVRDRLLAPFVERGYLGIEVALREGSRDPAHLRVGRNDYLRFYAEDSVAIVNWLVHAFGCGMVDGQPNTAKIGMVGTSMLGVSQLQLIAHPDLPAALRAIVPAVAEMSYAVMWYPGGMLPGPGRVARSGGEFPRIFPRHRDFDEFWETRQITRRKLLAPASRGVAMLMIGGWDDYLTPGGIEIYEDYLSLTGVERKKLMISSAGHGTPMELYLPLAMQWLDHWLKGTDNGAADDRVAIWVRGAERWRVESEWPIPDTVRSRLYLSGESYAGLDSENAGVLSLVPRANDRNFSYRYDPENGPFLHTMVSANAEPPNNRRLQMDHSADESRVASWTSAPLAAAVEMTGFPVLTLWASSSTKDADFVAQITDVEPDGTSRTVISGYLNGPRQAHADRNTATTAPPEPLEPGVPRQFRIKLQPTAYVFPAGHRIRIAVAGGTEAGFGADGKPQNAPQGPGRNPQGFEVTLRQGEGFPSYLELPMIGRGARVLEQSNQTATDHKRR
jgi:predicted acyl esterase